MNAAPSPTATAHDRTALPSDWAGARQIAAAGAACWVAVGALEAWDIARDNGGEGVSYALFSVALLAAAALTVIGAAMCTTGSARAALRWCAIGLGALAVASTVVAWASPLWMTLIALSLATFAVAAEHAMRVALFTVAAAHVLGIVVTVVAIEAEVGPKDSYGDYPTGAGLGVVVAVAGSAAGMAALANVMRCRRP